MPRLSRKHLATILATVFTLFLPVALFAATVNGGFDGLDIELKKFTKGVVTSTGYMLFTLATVAFFFGIVQFIWSARQGSEGKGITRGKQFMMWGLIGLFVMFSVWGIVKFAQGVFGIQGDNVITVPNLKFNVNGSTDTTSPLSAADYRNAADIQSDNATAARQAAAAAKASSGVGTATGKSTSTGGRTPIAPVTVAQKIEAAKDSGEKQPGPSRDIGESCTYEVEGNRVLDNCAEGSWCVSGICKEEAGEDEKCTFDSTTDSCGPDLDCDHSTNRCIADTESSSSKYYVNSSDQQSDQSSGVEYQDYKDYQDCIDAGQTPGNCADLHGEPDCGDGFIFSRTAGCVSSDSSENGQACSDEDGEGTWFFGTINADGICVSD